MPIARRENRMVFVVGSPRSGTTFVGNALGSQPGFVDLGEVPLLKAAVPRLVGRPVEEQAREVRRIVQLVRNLGLVHGLRGVEQNPETSYVLDGALRAYPRGEGRPRDPRRPRRRLLAARARLARSRSRRHGRREAGVRRARAVLGRAGAPARVRGSERGDAAPRGRGARYVTAARAAPEQTVELRYEALVADPDARGATASRRRSTRTRRRSRAAFAEVHADSVGRWRKDLTPEQLADVEAEAGALLAELGYA